ncbi:hypothetical protein Q0Z83_110070 [Actinoplanes sichuanensis]|uniref:Uncharacterized protein n=1 Tax=Actinoplanes sichuanensis TaxID=512349 RepID=A0ABW4A257_9ACTN|nr:hypothetical protein [Actinoplanes sichuanensis]BEL12816.1 hypothetical protein Q0Z83_110070 [Actinoplanes sichuanensis]
MGEQEPTGRSGERRQPDVGDSEVDWRVEVLRHAVLLRAFEPDVFVVEEEKGEAAGLAAGALVLASTYVIDELFEDLRTLAENGGTVADNDGFLVLEDLPPRFAHHYDGRFARKFLVATVAITGRLSAEQWSSPASVAEALALHVVTERAKYLLIDHGFVTKEQVRDFYSGFQDAAFDDVDHELLYQGNADGFEEDDDISTQLGLADMRIGSWFEEFDGSDASVHPFTIDVAVPEPHGS